MYKSTVILLAAVVLGCLAAAPEIQHYELKQDKVCFLADLAIQVTVKYETKDSDMKTVQIPVPKDTIVSGLCAQGGDLAELVIDFQDMTLSMNFSDTSGSVVLSGVSFEYQQDSSLFPNASESGDKTVAVNETLLSMGKDKQYFQCHSLLNVDLGQNVSVQLYSTKVQAFNLVDGKYSSDAYICPQDQPTPKPTPTPGPTPTVQPTKPPQPTAGNWTVKDDDGTVCIVAKMGARFNITYKTKDKKNASVEFDLPTNAEDGGSKCGNETELFSLKFFDNWMLDFYFDAEAAAANDKKVTEYSVHNITLTYYETAARFPNSSADPTKAKTARLDGQDLFRAGIGGSFVCQSKTSLQLSNNVTIDTWHLRLQAFKSGNGTDFVGNEMECPADSVTDSIVPIAVGAALAALVAIVLIAYIIGRKRSRTGYENV